MPIKLQCPQCRKGLTVPDQLAGRIGKCPACGASVSVPPSAPASVSPAIVVPPPPLVAPLVRVSPSARQQLRHSNARLDALRKRSRKFWFATAGGCLVGLYTLSMLWSGITATNLASNNSASGGGNAPTLTQKPVADDSSLVSIPRSEALARIKRLGGTVYFMFDEPSAVSSISFSKSSVTDSDLILLRAFPSIPNGVDLSNTKVTDAGLRSLEGLEIGELDCRNTAVTDSGIRSVAAIRNLKTLTMSGTQISMAGLNQLKNKSSFNRLVLDETRIPDTAYDQLKSQFPSAYIFLSHNSQLSHDDEWGSVNRIIFSQLGGDKPEMIAFDVRVINNLAKQAGLSNNSLRELVQKEIAIGERSRRSSLSTLQILKSSLAFRAELR